jgi:hypothetical protein
MTFEEYVRYREEFLLDHDNESSVYHIFKQLITRPVEEGVEADCSKIWTAINQLGNYGQNLRGITQSWYSMQPYWKWVTMMYGPEIVDRFGGLNIVDPGLLPMGMVSVFREKRVTWQE